MKSRILHLFVLALFCAGLFPMPAVAQVQTGYATDLPRDAGKTLQLNWGSQVYLFDPEGLTMADLKFSLRVEYDHASPVVPLQTTEGGNPPFGQVDYINLWPGIDLSYTQTGDGLKSAYYLAAGADPADIRLKYNRPVTIQPDGSLAFSYDTGSLTESAPVAWQEEDGERRFIEVTFIVSPGGYIGFEVSGYDRNLPLVIDPDYTWHTFFGGYNSSEAAAAVYGADGSLVVVGTSSSVRYGDKQMEIIRLDAFGNRLNIIDFGGSDNDDVAAAVTQQGGYYYVVGTSDAAFTYFGNTPIHTYSGSTDITVVCLDDELHLVWFTFLGSSDFDYGRGIAVSSTNDVYVTGESLSSWTYGTNVSLHPHSGGSDIAAIKLDQNGAYTWHTFYGSQGEDYVGGAALELDSYLWLVGTSDSSWKGPAYANFPKNAHAGGKDIAVLILESSGAYNLHTFWGSSSDDYGKAVAVDISGLAYFTGYSQATWGTPKHAHSGGMDLSVFKLDDNGTFFWNTFYGSSGDDYGYDLEIDTNSNIYISGSSPQSWNGPTGQTPVYPYRGSTDELALVLTSAGNYSAHSFFGSEEADSAAGVACKANGQAAVVGTNLVEWFGPAGEAAVFPTHGAASMSTISLHSNLQYQWHTFVDFDLAVDWSDQSQDIAITSDGSSVVVGLTHVNFKGDKNQLPLNAYSEGADDLFILKLDPNGEYLWHAIYGGLENDHARGVAIDSHQNIYVVGTSGATWNGPSGQAPLHAFTSGNANLLVLKLNSSGNYVWHTFFGAASGISGQSLDKDSSDNIYIVSESFSSWNGPAGQAPLHAFSGDSDITVLKLNGKGEYQWHTFYGSSTTDSGYDISVRDTSIVVAGASKNNWMGPTGQRPKNSHSGSALDGAILKLNQSGSYLWHSFYGGTSNFTSVYVAKDLSVYAGGYSQVVYKGPSGESPVHTPGSKSYSSVAHVVKVDGAGAYEWHGFFGAVGSNQFMGITGGPNGDIYLAGYSDGIWEGNNSISPVHAYSGASRDGMVLRLSSSGEYRWHSFYGPAFFRSIVFDSLSQSIRMAGYSNGNWSGDNGELPLHPYAAGSDIVVLNLQDSGSVNPNSVFIPFVQK